MWRTACDRRLLILVFSLKELGQITDIESDLIPDTDNFTEAIKEVFSIEDFEPIDTSNEELNNIKVAKGNKALELVDNCEVKSFDEAVIEIKRLKEQRLGNTAIAKKLTGKYQTKQGKTNWSDTQVRRILISRVE